MEIDEVRLKDALRRCLRDRAGLGGCPFYEELGSCYECSWPHALAFIVSEAVYGAWREEIMVELQPEIDARPPLPWCVLTTASASIYNPDEATLVGLDKEASDKH